VPDELWRSYAEHTEASLEDRGPDLYKNQHAYRLTGLRLFTGFASFEDRGVAAQNALMRLLLSSIKRWETGWNTVLLVKLYGESHSIEVESLISYWLRTKPWISFDEEDKVIHCTPSERWFVPALVQASQKANFDHLAPLPPSVSKLIIKHEARDVLRALGLRTFDPEDSAHAKDMLDALAAAFDRLDPALRHIFLGQLRTLWQHFHPELYPEFPRALVVLIAGKQLCVVEPSSDNPVYLPDEGIATDAGTAFGPLPIVVMFRSDASRLAGPMAVRWGQGVRLLSSVKLEAWSGDTRWTPSGAAVPLMTSPLRWLASFALAVAAFSGAAYGTQTERFRAAAATFRGARLERVLGLSVQLSGANDGARHVRDALWEPVSNTLLYDLDAESVEPLASPLQSMLARNDIATALRLALSKLAIGSDEDPTDAQLGAALTSVDVTIANIDEVRRALLGDLPFVVARLRPALALLVPSFDQASLTNVATEDDLRSQLLKTSLADVVPCEWLLERCREASSDRALGRDLSVRLGAVAELRQWNAALGSLGPPYGQLMNDEWRDQTEHHLCGAEAALHAIARKLARDGLVSFPVAREALDAASVDGALGGHYWTVPFFEALRSRKGVLGELGASPDILAAFDNASDSEALTQGLRRADPSIDLDVDPSQLFADNKRACETCVDAVQRIAAVHWTREKTILPAWVRDPGTLHAALEKDLQEGLGYLDRMDKMAVFALVRQHLQRSDSHVAFWSAVDDASDPSSLALALEVTEADRAKASDTIDADRERQRKSARTIQVCGSSFDPDESNLNQLWDHIRAQIGEVLVERVDLLDLAALDEMRKRKRPKQKERPPGKRGKLHVKRPPERVRDVIGLAGEIHVYRTLLATFGPEVVTPACWKSSLSLRCFSTNTANDGAGHDFAVSKGKRRYFLEVKSTSEPPSEEDEVELGVSELRCAEEKKNKKNQVFRIVRVFDALSTRPQIILLPNPRDDDAHDLYDIQDANYRLRFRRSRMDSSGGLHG
jgi:hypothetical protein